MLGSPTWRSTIPATTVATVGTTAALVAWNAVTTDTACAAGPIVGVGANVAERRAVATGLGVVTGVGVAGGTLVAVVTNVGGIDGMGGAPHAKRTSSGPLSISFKEMAPNCGSDSRLLGRNLGFMFMVGRH